MVKVNQVKSKYKSQRDALVADTIAIKEQVGVTVCSHCTNDCYFESEEGCKVGDKYRNDLENRCPVCAGFDTYTLRKKDNIPLEEMMKCD